MEDAGVIVRVEQPTDWRAPMIVVPKKDDVRICVELLTTFITPLEDSVSSDCPSAFHHRRNTSREGR